MIRTVALPSKIIHEKGCLQVGFINVSVSGIHRSMIVEPSSWRPVLCVAFTLMCALERVPGWSGVMTTGAIAKVLLVMLMQHVVSRVLMIKALCPAIPTVRRFVAHHHCCPRCHRRYWPPLDLALEARLRRRLAHETTQHAQQLFLVILHLHHRALQLFLVILHLHHRALQILQLFRLLLERCLHIHRLAFAGRFSQTLGDRWGSLHFQRLS